MLGAWVGGQAKAARGVPERFLKAEGKRSTVKQEAPAKKAEPEAGKAADAAAGAAASGAADGKPADGMNAPQAVATTAAPITQP